MKVCNCSYYELEKLLQDEKIIIFGVGDYFHFYMEEHFPDSLRENVAYFVDDNTQITFNEVWGRRIAVYKAHTLKKENKCVIVLGSTNYIKDMYEQLIDMNLNDEISCYIYPFTLINSQGKTDKDIKEKIFINNVQQKIPKIIHSFWFSGDDKPKEYQACVDSWKKFCPDYKIMEWNMHNYDYTKNRFMNQAIEARKWAFASDVARLDILYNQGGIYMDMDVEVIRNLDGLLGNKAFFTFDAGMDIDLEMFGTQPKNLLLKNIMEIYENIDFSDTHKFCQPRFIRKTLKNFGLRLNGDTQVINGMVFFSRNYLSPKDFVIYELNVMSEETYAIHHFNAGWKSDDFRKKRIVNNREIWNKIK